LEVKMQELLTKECTICRIETEVDRFGICKWCNAKLEEQKETGRCGWCGFPVLECICNDFCP